MINDYLDFEKPIAELDEKINELRRMSNEQGLNIAEEITTLRNKSQTLIQQIFNHLSPQQIVQLARHPNRPHTEDYIKLLFDDFDELHGDRHYASGKAIIGGIARFEGQPVMVIGHEKGRTTKEKVERNFGMPKPESFRRALRLMQLAEKFSLPVITFIDTPGAYPGVGAEERNQSEAIAKNLYTMSTLKTPIVSVVIGEGCSGGALGLGVSDQILMLQYSYYAVISPEGCASILWKSSDKASLAAEAMGLTADALKKNNLIDEIIPEPLGGAHRDHNLTAENIKKSLQDSLHHLQQLSIEQLVEARYDYWINKGLKA